MSDSRQQAVIERVRKLLALSGNNPNENEAAAAAAKVQEILAEHNLDVSCIEGTSNDKAVRDNDLLTYRAAWVKPLLNEVAKLCMCGYFSQAFPSDWVKRNGFDKNARKLLAGGNSRIYLKHSFIGTRVNIIIAKNLAEYLISTMETLCKDGEALQRRDERLSFRFSFMNACSNRLCYRLAKRREETSAQGIHTEKTNLPALRSIYEQAHQMYEDWLADNGVKVKQKNTVMKILHAGGARAGDKAGNDIGLDIQVSNTNGNTLKLQ